MSERIEVHNEGLRGRKWWEQCQAAHDSECRKLTDHRTAILLDPEDEKVIEIAEASAVTILERSLLGVLKGQPAEGDRTEGEA